MIGMTNSINLSPGETKGSYVGTLTSSGYQFIPLGFTPQSVQVTCSDSRYAGNKQYNGTATAVVDSTGKILSVRNGLANGTSYETTIFKPGTGAADDFHHYISVAIGAGGFYVFYCSGSTQHAYTATKGLKFDYVANR